MSAVVLKPTSVADVPSVVVAAAASADEESVSGPSNNGVIAIVDAGSQFGKLIDRRVRECGVKTELFTFDTKAIELREYAGIIISGGPSSVYAEDAPSFDNDMFELGVPVLGICYGFQLITAHFGGKIEKTDTREDGQFPVTLIDEEPLSSLFKGIGSDSSSLKSAIPLSEPTPSSKTEGTTKKTTTLVLLTHGDSVTDLGSELRVTSVSPTGIISSGEHLTRPVFGVQFHPEVDLSEEGGLMFRNFLFDICNCKADFTLDSRRQQSIDYIQSCVGKSGRVLALVSGGVDSSVCTTLLFEALESDQIMPVHFDHGFMRELESERVSKALKESRGIELTVLSCADDFLTAKTMIDGMETERLCDTIDPEIKRKIIGDTFIRKCEELMIGDDQMLIAQGTLRPDLIESASKVASKAGSASVIKTHHNDTALVRALREEGRVIEPLTDLHKDEVRRLGSELGLPDWMVHRQPFPGPGLAIRVICSDKTPYTTDNDEEMARMLSEVFSKDGINACLFGFRTVGVQGDGRSYNHCVGLSVNDTSEEGTGIPWDRLFDLAKEIPRRMHSVNRVIFVMGKPLKSGLMQSVTETRLNKDTLNICRKADFIVSEHLKGLPLSQVPVILFPSDFGVKGMRSVCIRAFVTRDFMTGLPARIPDDISQELLFKINEDVLSQLSDSVIRVCYDLTPKPPGTTEWE